MGRLHQKSVHYPTFQISSFLFDAPKNILIIPEIFLPSFIISMSFYPFDEYRSFDCSFLLISPDTCE